MTRPNEMPNDTPNEMSHEQSHDAYQELMVDVLFGEAGPDAVHRLEAHLDTCDACADEFASLQATLSVTAERERPAPPDGFWDAFDARLHQRLADATSEPVALASDKAALADPAPGAASEVAHAADTGSIWTSVRAWWNGLPALLPATSGQWALQGAMLAAVLLVGVYGGQQSAQRATVLGGAETSGGSDFLQPVGSSTSAPGMLLPGETYRTATDVLRPSVASVEDITYDVASGTVEVRYNMVSDVIVRGRPDDPKVRRLLQTALLDEGNPSSRLHAVKTLEASKAAPDPDVVQALTYLVRSDDTVAMRLRALRALGSMHADAPMNHDTRNVLLNLLLTADDPALRLEAIDVLSAVETSPQTVDAIDQARRSIRVEDLDE